MNVEEIIDDLKAQIQQLEDAKQQLTETQQELRETISILQVPDDEQVCEACHKSFPEGDMIETEYGWLCQDCFRDKMELEDAEIYE